MQKISIVKLLVPAVLLVFFFQASLTYAQKETTSATQTKNGLHITKFSTPQGDIAVYFPGDGSAGDRICGTVISKPSGKNEKKIEKNKGVLEGYVLELEEDQNNHTGVKNDQFQWLIPLAVGEVMHLLMKDQNGNLIASADIPVNPEQQNMQFPEVVEPTDYSLPGIIQAGTPATITGCFNSDISNTAVMVSNESAAILAESPRQCVFMAPENIVGPADIRLTEGEITATGKTNSLDLNLTADKLSLMKGEKTSVHLEITGLDNIQEPVPFEINNLSSGIINLTGGNNQHLEIEPAQVSSEGVYQQDFNVTATSAGSYTLVAQVTPPPPAIIMLVYPEDEMGSSTTNFLWTGLNVPSDATYTFKIWKVKEYESQQELTNFIVPYEEVKQGVPYYVREGITKQSFDYSQVMDAPLHPNNLYAWQVTAVYPDGTQLESNLENLMCCPLEDYEHIEKGNDKTSYIPSGYKHIDKGYDKSKYYNPDIPEGYVHVASGMYFSTIIPKDYQHIETTGPDKSKYYPGWMIHLTKGNEYSKLIPNGYTHITDGKDASKYKPQGGKHITSGPDITKYSGKFHITEGKNPSTYETKIVPPVTPDNSKVKEGEKPVNTIKLRKKRKRRKRRKRKRRRRKENKEKEGK